MERIFPGTLGHDNSFPNQYDAFAIEALSNLPSTFCNPDSPGRIAITMSELESYDTSQTASLPFDSSHSEDIDAQRNPPTSVTQTFEVAKLQLAGAQEENNCNMHVKLFSNINDLSSSLVEFYFRNVASMFSCFDGERNPFRTKVAQVWTNSPAMYYTLQSMAAACLVQELPMLRQAAKQLRLEAISLAKEVSQSDPPSLLVLLMIGQTSSWFEPNDLGVGFFKEIQSRLARTLPDSSDILGSCNAAEFFQHALTYWRMLLAFVTSEIDDVEQQGKFASTPDILCIPHPWTGVCDSTLELLEEVGQLVRKQRFGFRSAAFVTEELLQETAGAIAKARLLESKLLAAKRWSSEEIFCPGDLETPTWHLQLIAEIYRRVGLLNLYRVFPDLRIRRYRYETALKAFWKGGTTHYGDEDEGYLSWLCISDTFRLEKAEDESNQLWLTAYALKTIQLLENIPTCSRTRCLQPLLLVSCASELRAVEQLHDQGAECHDSNFPDVDASLRLLQARRFVRGRLNFLSSVRPPLPIRTCLAVVEQVWHLQDSGRIDVYWIDVMLAHGWQTTMG